MFFDTHAHYDDNRFDVDRDSLLESMQEAGVSIILNAGSSIANSCKGLQIAEKYPFVYAAVGVHPHNAKDMDDNSISELHELLLAPKALAVGEIGLDYHYNHSPAEIQKQRFREQLELARATKMPVIIHEREAFADVMEIIAEYSDLHGVFHCFSGDKENARRLLDMGWLLSFTGVLTFKKSSATREVAAYVPLERLMLETDAPYLSPEPLRGSRNDSRNLIHIARRLADERGISVEELAAVTTQNGRSFFRIPD